LILEGWDKLHFKNGAGEEIRTLDIHLGRVALYQLSYARKQNKNGGAGWIRTTES
jgi:hypothetical protein